MDLVGEVARRGLWPCRGDYKATRGQRELMADMEGKPIERDKRRSD